MNDTAVLDAIAAVLRDSNAKENRSLLDVAATLDAVEVLLQEAGRATWDEDLA